MDMGGMDMGGMDMSGTGAMPMNHASFPRIYWAIVGTVVGLATLVNLANLLIYRQRLSEARRNRGRPSLPKSLVLRLYATMTAVAREITYPSPPSIAIRSSLRHRRLVWGPGLFNVGRTMLVVANLVVLMVLCFHNLHTQDQWQWEDIGYRTGYVAIGQLPLLFLLAGRNNIVGLLVGSSYERLNWLHRWLARTFFLTVTLHMYFWLRSWARWDYIEPKIKSDLVVQRGLAAWAVLAWIVLSSLYVFRKLAYEFFVVQHIVSFTALLVLVYLHTPVKQHVWIWLPLGAFAFDRCARAGSWLYCNLSILHRRRAGPAAERRTLWACQAEVVPMWPGATRLTVRDPPISWEPGQHVFLSCHSILPLQSHPFTIASLPRDGQMEFLVQARSGGTRHLFRHAHQRRPTDVEGKPSAPDHKTVTIEGPYGRMTPLRQFDSVVLFAGGAGATFTIPLIRDLIWQWGRQVHPREGSSSFWLDAGVGIVTRHVRFVWVVRSSQVVTWLGHQLYQVTEDLDRLRGLSQDYIQVTMSVYVTCDQRFTDEDHHNDHDLVNEMASLDGESQKRRRQQHPMVEASNSDGKSTFVEAVGDREGNLPGSPSVCCCTKIVEEENRDVITAASCVCHSTSSPSSSSSSAVTTAAIRQPDKDDLNKVHPKIIRLSGRPQTRNILRRTLEQALGETAVVVCGPCTLMDTVRNDVVALSDERAVHKGTGAQGIYLHCESFSG